MNNSYLIIDVSYYNFYRYYALKTWYKNAYPEDDFELGYDYSQNVIFLNKFKKMFNTHITKYKKLFKPSKTILARDCKRKDIWRCAFYKDYKGTREATYKKNKFMGGKLFKYSYDHIIPQLLSEDTIQIKIPQLEADDIIFLSVKKILKSDPTAKIYIISSDHDLLQILDNNKNIDILTANLKSYKNKSKGSADENNFYKALLGDASDNIPKAFLPIKGKRGVGVKSIEKLYNNQTMLLEYFDSYEGSFSRYTLNRLLVDFKYIPVEFLEYFEKNIKI
tara:strand:+ start:8510 stop:9343 length:834 start_codon:yes stop_codon:yes gene_type:complete